MDKKIIAAIGIILVLLAIPLTVYLVQKRQELRTGAVASTVLSFPEEVTKEVGETFAVGIQIDSGENQVVGADLNITFNPSVLECLSLSPGDFLTNPIEPPLVEDIDNQSGRILYSVASFGSQQGTGVFASINFRAKSVGVSSLTFESGTSVAGIGENEALLESRSGRVVVEEASVTPTPTPTPPADCPECPDNVGFGSSLRGDGKYDVIVVWHDVANNEEYYQIYRDGDLIHTLPADSTRYIDTNADKGFVLGEDLSYRIDSLKLGCPRHLFPCDSHDYQVTSLVTPTPTPAPTPTPTAPVPTPTPSGYLELDLLKVWFQEQQDLSGRGHKGVVILALKQGGNVVLEKAVQLDEKGEARNVELPGITAGTYDAFVYQAGYLTKKLSSVSLEESGSVLDFTKNGTEYFLVGDFNGDQEVNVLDFSIFVDSYGERGEE